MILRGIYGSFGFVITRRLYDSVGENRQYESNLLKMRRLARENGLNSSFRQCYLLTQPGGLCTVRYTAASQAGEGVLTGKGDGSQAER